MRQDEIARVEWKDFDAESRMLLIRDRKDPRRKTGNNQKIPLLDVSGYDACKIIEEQGRYSNFREGRIFPYNGRSVGTAFRRQCKDLEIDDLHFHDLRHEGTSRLTAQTSHTKASTVLQASFQHLACSGSAQGAY